MRTALTAVCILTLLAVAYLSVSLIVLQPPRANYPIWFTLAAVLGIQGGLTLWLVAGAPAPAVPVVRPTVLAGGCALMAIGVWMVRDNADQRALRRVRAGARVDADRPGRAHARRLPAVAGSQNGLNGSIGVTLPCSSYTARWM